MKLRYRIEILVEKITKKECKNCKYNKGFVCESPKRDLCISNIFPKGFEPKEKGGAEE